MLKGPLTIHRKGDESFDFTYYKNSSGLDIAEERAEVVRLMDDATDALMRKNTKVESCQLNSSSPVHRIKLCVGDDEANQ